MRLRDELGAFVEGAASSIPAWQHLAQRRQFVLKSTNTSFKVQNDLTLKIIDSGESFFPISPLLKKALQHGLSLIFLMLADLPARLSSASFESVDWNGLLCVFRQDYHIRRPPEAGRYEIHRKWSPG